MSKELKELVKILLKVALLVIYILQMVDLENLKLSKWGYIKVYNDISYVMNIACSPSSRD